MHDVLEGVDWEEQPLNQDLVRKANALFSNLPNLNEIRIDQCLRDPKPVENVELHVFVDASKDDYGAAASARQLYNDGSNSPKLVVSKSRVAPI